MSQPNELSHHIVISGASQGIGAAVAEAFAAGIPGVRLSLLARNEDNLARVASMCTALGAHAEAFTCDVRRADDIARATMACTKAFGTATAVVNNAGTFEPGGISGTTPDQLQHQFDVNVMSAFNLSKALLPAMREARRGHLFFMASIASFKGYPSGLAYGVTKHAMLGLARSLREELKPDGIRVTSLMPGATFTPTWDGAGFDEARMMPPEDVASALLNAYRMSPRTVVEEILLRPQLGDL